MRIEQIMFPQNLYALANSKWFFSDPKNSIDPLAVISTFKCGSDAVISLTKVGVIGFEFPKDGIFASIEQLKFRGSGIVPKEISQNEGLINSLQEKRIRFVNFVIACLLGSLTFQKHTSLKGAQYVGQDKIGAFLISNKGVLRLQSISDIDKSISDKLTVQQTSNWSLYPSPEELSIAVSTVQELNLKQKEFRYADLESCMVTTYQASILHNQQQATASFALNFLVLESLIKEIFYSRGIIEGEKGKEDSFKSQIDKKISKNKFSSAGISILTKILAENKVIDAYMFQRVEEFRLKRNELMHKGSKISHLDSGAGQNIVRDMWNILINERLDLNSGWTYRR